MKFYWKRNLSLYLALTGVFASSVLAADKSDLELEQRLNQSLQSLEDHARHERYVSGITSLTFAGLSTIAAFATISNSQPVIPATLGVLGALFGVSGGLTLAFPTDFERMPERYRLLPSDSADLRHSKVMVGELTLDQLSASARSSRLTGAGVLCAFGAGFGIWYAFVPNRSQYSLLLFESIFFVGLGVFSFFTETEAESANRNYREWKNSTPKLSDIHWDVFPTPSGAMLAGTLRF